MRAEEREIALWDGTRCLLRSPRAEDGEAVLRHLRRVSGESPYTAFLPEELGGTLRQEQAFLKRQLASPNRLMLACFAAGGLIGLGGLGPAASAAGGKRRSGGTHGGDGPPGTAACVPPHSGAGLPGAGRPGALRVQNHLDGPALR